MPPTSQPVQHADYNAACRPGNWKPLELDGVATEGLKIDEQARVINIDGAPIDNLYAAGEAAAMYFNNHCGGTSVLRGLVYGRRAGQNAAQVLA